MVVERCANTAEKLSRSTVLPKLDEVGLHFFEESGVVCGGIWIDDIEDALFGNDHTVTEALPLRSMARPELRIQPLRILTLIVAFTISNDVGIARLAQYQRGVMEFVLLYSMRLKWLAASCSRRTEKSVSELPRGPFPAISPTLFAETNPGRL